MLHEYAMPCHAMQTVKLNENPIGQRGGRAIFRALRKLVQYNWAREVQIFGCNYDFIEPGLPLFDPQEPGGAWECDLAQPYDRMVAWELVELAWNEDGENWNDETLDGDPFELEEPPPGVVWTRADYQLPWEGVSSKALSFCCAPTVFLAKIVPFHVVPLCHRCSRSSTR
eukprot:SAG22_NODE_875_length_6716_cov_2.927006_5_plen_170_part_00